MLRIVRLWMDHGVRIFRVDTPHTKPVSFWHRLLEEIRRSDPTSSSSPRPSPSRHDAHAGEDRLRSSYTYFTWRNSKHEIYEYFTELRDAAAYMRPNAFVNTPDILHAYLQYGGPAAFKVRRCSPPCSRRPGACTPVRAVRARRAPTGSEEYLDSEKYQYRPRDWAAYEPGGRREGRPSRRTSAG